MTIFSISDVYYVKMFSTFTQHRQMHIRLEMNIEIHKVYRKRDLTLKTRVYPNNRHTHITCIYPTVYKH